MSKNMFAPKRHDSFFEYLFYNKYSLQLIPYSESKKKIEKTVTQNEE